MGDLIEGLKLVYWTGRDLDDAHLHDDPDHPFKLYFNFSPPEFMGIAWIFAHGGSEEIVVRTKTREAIDEFMQRNDFYRHPRFRRGVLTLPDGKEEKLERRRQ